jgi:CubicO group peptidase (beta-lactamase class C family)
MSSKSVYKQFALGLLCISVVSGLASAQETTDSRVDRLFEEFQGKSPGCAAGVVRDGKVLFTKAYGLADLERETPLSSDTPFYMASLSKQFTAMSVLLLAEDGKLQTTDSVRKTIPELPGYANQITLYHLLTHTSGVRDYLTLGSLSGNSPDFVYTDRGFLRAVFRQSALNFVPGSEYLYSNSGYVLLSLVVKQVAGKNLNAFAQDRVFGPLGMKSTRFQHDHSALIPGKALGYERRQDGWHLSNSMFDVVGDGGLYSSVQDMLRWAKNFDSPTIGAKALAIMQTRGRLQTGGEIDYGMGLAPGEYRGLPIVDHSGGLAGYRTEFLRFPAQKLSVVCLCNSGTANPSRLARQIAEVYLGDEIKPAAAFAPKTVSGIAVTADDLSAMAGLYRNDDEGYVEVLSRDGKLRMNSGPPELIPLDRRRFTAAEAPDGFEIEFGAGTVSDSFEVRLPRQPSSRYVRVKQLMLSETERSVYTGDFESTELQAVYRIVADSDGLRLEFGDRPTIPLTSGGADRLRAAGPGLELAFVRDAAGNVSGFRLSAGRVRGIIFSRRQSSRENDLRN